MYIVPLHVYVTDAIQVFFLTRCESNWWSQWTAIRFPSDDQSLQRATHQLGNLSPHQIHLSPDGSFHQGMGMSFIWIIRDPDGSWAGEDPYAPFFPRNFNTQRWVWSMEVRHVKDLLHKKSNQKRNHQPKESANPWLMVIEIELHGFIVTNIRSGQLKAVESNSHSWFKAFARQIQEHRPRTIIFGDSSIPCWSGYGTS